MHTETTGVVKVIKKKWKDNSLHKVGCEILYGIIKRDYMDYPTVHTAHNKTCGMDICTQQSYWILVINFTCLRREHPY